MSSKFWLAPLEPKVEEVRPPSCPVCATAAREPGRALGIVGHGRRDRQQRGPRGAEEAPVTAVLRVRRYRCRGCRAILTVVPCEVAPRRHYSRPAIALALARQALLHESAAAVRRAISPWAVSATSGWPTLGRWQEAIAAGTLLPQVQPRPGATGLEIAARSAHVAMAHAPPSLRGESMLAQVYAGATAMA